MAINKLGTFTDSLLDRQVTEIVRGTQNASPTSDGLMSKEDAFESKGHRLTTVLLESYGTNGTGASYTLADAGYSLSSAQEKYPAANITTTDTQLDTACIKQAVSDALFIRGELVFGGKDYFVDTTVIYLPVGGYCSIKGVARTNIKSSNDLPIMEIQGSNYKVQSVRFLGRCTSSVKSTDTAILIGSDATLPSGLRFTKIDVSNFAYGVKALSLYNSYFTDCWIGGCNVAGLYIESQYNYDTGDNNFTNCIFFGYQNPTWVDGDNSIAVWYRAGGGNKFSNCAFINWKSQFVLDTIAVNPGNEALPLTGTGFLIITGCKFDNINEYGIKLAAAPDKYFNNSVITGNILTQYNGAWPHTAGSSLIYVDGVSNMTITGNLIIAANDCTAISLLNNNLLNVTGNEIIGMVGVNIASTVTKSTVGGNNTDGAATPYINNSTDIRITSAEYRRIIKPLTSDSQCTATTSFNTIAPSVPIAASNVLRGRWEMLTVKGDFTVGKARGLDHTISNSSTVDMGEAEGISSIVSIANTGSIGQARGFTAGTYRSGSGIIDLFKAYYSEGTNTGVTEYYHFYGQGDYPAYFGGTVQAVRFSGDGSQLTNLPTSKLTHTKLSTPGVYNLEVGKKYVLNGVGAYSINLPSGQAPGEELIIITGSSSTATIAHLGLSANGSYGASYSQGVDEGSHWSTILDGSVWACIAKDKPASGASQWVSSGSDIYYSTGKVGIGTAPSYQVHVKNTARPSVVLDSTSGTGGDRGQLIFKRIGTTGGAIQAGNALGALHVIGHDGSAYDENSGYGRRMYELTSPTTWATNAGYVDHVFNTLNGSLSPVERLRIKSTGIINIANITEYTGNADASAVLAIGDVYRTGDILKIVH